MPVFSHSGDPANPWVLEPGPVVQLAHRCCLQRRIEMCHIHARINIALRKVCEDDAVPAKRRYCSLGLSMLYQSIRRASMNAFPTEHHYPRSFLDASLGRIQAGPSASPSVKEPTYCDELNLQVQHGHVNRNAANFDHLQLLSLSVKDPRPPVERAPLPERSLGGGAVVGERHPPDRSRGRRPHRQFAAERRDPGREGRALGNVVRRSEERRIAWVI